MRDANLALPVYDIELMKKINHEKTCALRVPTEGHSHQMAPLMPTAM